jgi:hypothetical protein
MGRESESKHGELQKTIGKWKSNLKRDAPTFWAMVCCDFDDCNDCSDYDGYDG